MSIKFLGEKGLFLLETENTSYQMKIGREGYLRHLYYGKRFAAGDADVNNSVESAMFSPVPLDCYKNKYDTSPNVILQEFSSFGAGDYRTPCLSARFHDGAGTVDLRYESHRIFPGKPKLQGLPAAYFEDDEVKSLEIVLKDRFSELRAVLLYTVCVKYDAVIRSAKIVNGEKQPVTLLSALSFCLDFPESDYDFIRFQGKATMERVPDRAPIKSGKTVCESMQGISSHSANPFVILCSHNADENCGECYGAALVYSGNFTAAAEVDPVGQTRLTMGINPNGFTYKLNAGEELQLPEALLCYSAKGFHTMSHNYHRLIREHLCRGEYKDKRRPVLVNSWEAFVFDFDSDKLVKLARDSARLGIEMLVIDDGWFGDRCDDDRALGDWYPNEKKLGGSLCELAKRVNAEGLKLGLWMEPEMISENSELFRKHPDWCLKSPDREPSVGRNQLVLDMSRREVVDYVYNTMSGLLDSANIEYLKWDMNRPLTDVYSPSLPSDRQGEVYHRYMLGVYDLLERLTQNYPHLLIEGCSSGGGRFDAGMLYYEPQIWTSDNSDPTERILIQYNTSFAYPLSAISAHISPSPNHSNGRCTPLNTRAVVAMTGAFGYELDVGALSDEEKQEIARQTEFYKAHYELFSKGEYFRLTDPYKGNIAAWSYVSEDKKQAFTGIMRKFAHNNSIPFIVRMQGLCEEAFYRVLVNGEEYGKPLSGSALMYAGLRFPYKKCDYEAFSVELYMIEK